MVGVAVVLQGAWIWYQEQLSAKPLRVQVVTSGVLWAAGDIMAQGLTRLHQSKTPSPLARKQDHRAHSDTFEIDWRRVLILSTFGAAFVAPVGHFWYESLDYVVSKRLHFQTASFKFVTVKLIAETLIFGPLHLLAFLTYMGVASGKSLEDIKGMIKRDFVPAFVAEGLVWPVVQAVNFRFVPVQHQLLYVNTFCLVDSVFLSWYKHQEDAAWKKRILSLYSPKHT